jgi:ABC transport system ATP-binding/permease protein
VLDEPTNDLDIESLELLEAALQDYDGTLLLVSHDRAFLDNVVTQTLAAEGNGHWHEYPGGYTDWLSQSGKSEGRSQKADLAQNPKAEGRSQKADLAQNPKAEGRSQNQVKLNNKEKRELESLPREIAALETEQQALSAKSLSPDYYRQAPDVLRSDQARNAEIEKLLMEKLERWETLEAKAKSAAS